MTDVVNVKNSLTEHKKFLSHAKYRAKNSRILDLNIRTHLPSAIIFDCLLIVRIVATDT